MVIKRGANVKRHYILTVCNMTCFHLCYFLPYPLRRRRLVLGRSVELRTPPPREFLNFVFNCVYEHI